MPDKKKPSLGKVIRNGLWDQNPVLIQLLGMCSTLAISTTVINGLGMGVSVTFVLVLSNLFISLLRNFIPAKIRIASYIVVIAGFVTIIDLLLKAYVRSLASSLGLFIPLIVVNCIILGRAEGFASRNGPLLSVADGFAMGVGYTLALVVISAVRELLGSGTLLGYRVMPASYSPAVLITSPVGGFLVLGALIALVQWLRARADRKEAKGDD